MTIRALLVDLDGVLRLWDSDNDASAEQAAGLPPGSIRAAAFAPDLLEPAITGRVSDDQWRSRIAQRLRFVHGCTRAESAVLQWSESSGRVDSAVLELVREARHTMLVALLTNATTRLGQDLTRLGLDRAFDHIFNSAAMGHTKPSHEVFRCALQSMQVSPERVLFVDDNPNHVLAAEKFGIRGHCYTDVSSLRRVLTQHMGA